MEYRQLGDLTINLDSHRRPVKNAERVPGPYPYYGASGVVDHVNGYLFDGQFLLIAEDGENLRTRQTPVAFLADGKFWVNNHAHIVQANETSDTRYIMYALQVADISAYLTGSTIPKLTQTSLNRISIPYRHREEQRAIADILGSLDDKIELNRRMSQTLEEIARTLFKSWFVDFDPVHAKAAGRQPVGMDAETASLFPSEFEDSELGLIPKGWEVSTLGQEFDVTMGQSPPGSTYNEDGRGLPFYQGRSDFGFRFPALRVYCTEPTRIAEAGDTLLSVRAPVGSINMADRKCAIGRGIAALRHKSGYSGFTYLSIQSLDNVLASFDTEGTVFGAISKGSLQGLRITRPPKQLVARFEEVIGPLDQSILGRASENSTLSSIRDIVLPVLISGMLPQGTAQ